MLENKKNTEVITAEALMTQSVIINAEMLKSNEAVALVKSAEAQRINVLYADAEAVEAISGFNATHYTLNRTKPQLTTANTLCEFVNASELYEADINAKYKHQVNIYVKNGRKAFTVFCKQYYNNVVISETNLSLFNTDELAFYSARRFVSNSSASGAEICLTYAEVLKMLDLFAVRKAEAEAEAERKRAEAEAKRAEAEAKAKAEAEERAEAKRKEAEAKEAEKKRKAEAKQSAEKKQSKSRAKKQSTEK